MTEPSRDTPAPRPVIDRGFLVLLGATLLAAIGVALQSGITHMTGIVLGALGFMALLLPKVAAGVVVAATIPVLIPRDRISRWIGRDSGVRGLIFATFAGALLPGGPSMAYPLAVSLMASGADVAASLAFLTAWSLFNLNRTLIWELSFLHADFVSLRVFLCLPLPVLLGLIVRATFGRS